MSGALPATPGFRTIKLKSVASTFVNIAGSGRRNARKTNYHLWEFTASYPPMTKAQFRPIWAFIMSQHGSYDSFTVIPPDTATPLGSAGGSPVVASNTASSVSITGATASQTGWLKAGDVITLQNDTKVYLVTADVNTNGSGAATIPVYPDLMTTPSVSDIVTVTNVAYTMMLRNPIQEYGGELGDFYQYEIDLIEAL